MIYITIIGIILTISLSVFMLIISVVGEGSIQSFSKAKLFCLYKNHPAFPYVKNFKENTTELMLSVLIASYLFNGIISTFFTILFINYLNISIGVTNLINTVVVMIIEVSMKKVSISSPEKSILTIGKIFYYLHKVIGKFANLINSLISLIMKYVFRYKEEIQDNDNELLSIIEMQGEQNKVMEILMKNILSIKNIYVDDVMTPQNKIIRINFNKNIEIIFNDILQMSKENVKSYLPLWNPSTESYMGIINTKKFLFDHLHRSKITMNYFKNTLLEDLFFVPSGTDLYKALNIFSKSFKNFACVLDEYGAIVGVISLKDILEEIVGKNLFDENIETPHINPQANEIMILQGDYSVKDLQEYFPNNFLSLETYSINDLIINDIQRIPEEGEEFTYNGISFTVLDRKNNTIDKVLVGIKKDEKQ